MNREALFCDGTGSYVFPPEPAPGQKIVLQFRTAAGDAENVLLLVNGCGYEMERKNTSGKFDYYAITWRLEKEMFRHMRFGLVILHVKKGISLKMVLPWT